MNGSISQACSACKYQRRKCGPDCILAPYFPHDHQRQFLNAHKLFGVGKIKNIIEPLDTKDRDIAMNTIIFQSDIRATDPVGGCYRHIQHLQSQIEYYKAELQLVLQHLDFCRAQAHPQPAQIQDVVYHSTANADQSVNLNAATSGHHYYFPQVPLHSQVQLPLSPLSLEDKNKDCFDYGYDQKPILDLIREMNSDDSRKL
ncbi:LOB domain-containing protein 22-like [Gastrolobium bilobum]|uniref:LOB domain-containing protein 22-like n=1 Tax=Gastrolobium bilobum TaxID=150636 RepID=UPI002AB0A12B|nr:LOB domain-containing protein 22-like [Gastrolobium bilobum]